MLDVPNNQSLPVVRITVVLNAGTIADSPRPRWVVRDNGGDFATYAVSAWSGDREEAKGQIQRECMNRMQHYCGLGYAVEPWSVPS